MNKQHILDEIRRTAKANSGGPYGSQRFQTETGIKKSDWYGKFWVRWGDALREAGLTPNRMAEAYDEDVLIAKLISLIRELGQFPVEGDLRADANMNLPSNFQNELTKCMKSVPMIRLASKHIGTTGLIRGAKNGEWFDLTPRDIKAFRRRKFM